MEASANWSEQDSSLKTAKENSTREKSVQTAKHLLPESANTPAEAVKEQRDDTEGSHAGTAREESNATAKTNRTAETARTNRTAKTTKPAKTPKTPKTPKTKPSGDTTAVRGF